VRGTLIASEKEEAMQKGVLALDGVMDCIKCFVERRIKTGQMPEEVEGEGKEEEEEKEEGEEEVPQAAEVKSAPGPAEEAGVSPPPAEEFEV